MPRKSIAPLLGLLLLGLGTAMAQELPAAPTRYETFNGFGPTERAALSDSQAAAFLDAVNTVLCPCGCAKGTLAQCRHVDPGCGVSRALVARAMSLVQGSPTVDGATLTGQMQSELNAQLEARRKAMEQQRLVEEARARAIHQVPVGDSAWKGVEHAKVTIIAFSEFQCPFCAKVNPTLKQLLQNYPNDVKVVFKHFIVHETAVPAAVAAVEAQAQGKFWEMHDKLFLNMRSQTRANIELWGQELDMDLQRLRTALDQGTHQARLDADQQLGQQIGVNSTPTLFVNGHLVLGALPYEVFQAQVQAEIAKAQKLLDAGVAPEKLYEELTKPQPEPAGAAGSGAPAP